MLLIEPTADGRLRISNNHRTDYARNETSARALAYSWGHTDISINKALTELRATARGEVQSSGWRTRRGEAPKVAAAPVRDPAAGEAVGTRTGEPARPPKTPRSRSRAPEKSAGSPAPIAPPAAAVPAPPAQPRKRTRAARSRAPSPPAAPTPQPEKGTRAPRKQTARPESAPAAAKIPSASAPRPAAAREAALPARERALSLFRAGAKELASLESETLAFARAPWTDLREMAEHIAACLEGKRPKTGWKREEG